MAGVEILYPQDPLKNRYNNHRSSFNNRRYTAAKSNQSSISAAPNRRKRTPPASHGGAPAKSGGRQVAGPVQILKRGESLAERYAGSAFFTSPPPSSLPVPAFFVKKAVPVAVVNDGATSDLRRILKLDL